MSESAPLKLTRLTVLPEWIDYNGHMNVAFYVLAFDKAVDVLFNTIGIGADYLKSHNASSFSLQIHINYLQEVAEGDELEFYARIMDYDHKRMHIYMEMHQVNQGYLAATMEQMGMHIDMEKRRSAPFPAHITENIQSLFEVHKDCPSPKWAGRQIAIPR